MNLTSLDVSCNNIETWPYGDISSLKSLVPAGVGVGSPKDSRSVRQISASSRMEVDQLLKKRAYKPFSLLLTLDLSCNDFISLGSMSGFRSLVELRLSYNRIAE